MDGESLDTLARATPGFRPPFNGFLRCVILAWWVGLGATACGPTTVNLYDPQEQIAPAPTAFDDRDWATVLRENVKDGLVDYEHLSSHAAPLERFLAAVAAAGPESTPELFPSGNARVAYYANAYNAAVLKAVVSAGIPPTMLDIRQGDLDERYRVRADRRVQKFADLRRAAVAESREDARIEFCLCNAAMGSPPLPSQPIRAGMLSEQLRQVAEEAMDNPQVVVVDHERQRLHLCVAIHQNRAGFIDLYRRQTGARTGTILNALLHMAGSRRREWLNTAVGYPVGTIPFDRRLNRWVRSEPGAQDGR